MTACPLCRRRADRPHDRCRDVLDERLERILGLYAMLGAALEPAGGIGAHVDETRTPPLPVRLEPFSLRARGGIIAILASWETDWRQTRRLPAIPARAEREHQLAGDQILADVVKFLRTHLDWAIDHHEAVYEFADEVRGIVAACHGALGWRTGLTRIGLCPTLDEDSELPCGRVLYVDPRLDVILCDGCLVLWPRDQWLDLAETIAGLSAATSRTDHAA